MTDLVFNYISQLGITEPMATIVAYGAISLFILLVTAIITWIVRNVLLRSVMHFIQHNKCEWDDALVRNNFFAKLSWFVPFATLYIAQDLLIPQDIAGAQLMRRLLLCAIALVTMRSILALLKTIHDIYRTVQKPGRASIRGYIDAANIITYVLGAIFIIAILTDRSPWGLLSVLGGLTAVTMLVFKDTILGFVASIQLSGTDMVRIGDWIEMPSHGADGDVIDVSIHCVRVQNWDKTISTIPTYALVSNAFKNWRGMSESGGRRIKRSINIDMNSVRFVTDEELGNLGKIDLISDYIKKKQQEIDAYNQEHKVDTSAIINGRRQTNIGIFRAYIFAYLRKNPMINQDMTFLVRHLKPTEHGLPIEIYVFSKEKIWANYETIQADIFDHLLAALPVFGLRIFQEPSGYDIRQLNSSTNISEEIHP